MAKKYTELSQMRTLARRARADYTLMLLDVFEELRDNIAKDLISERSIRQGLSDSDGDTILDSEERQIEGRLLVELAIK